MVEINQLDLTWSKIVRCTARICVSHGLFVIDGNTYVFVTPGESKVRCKHVGKNTMQTARGSTEEGRLPHKPVLIEEEGRLPHKPALIEDYSDAWQLARAGARSRKQPRAEKGAGISTQEAKNLLTRIVATMA
jgi:hypothetical protein